MPMPATKPDAGLHSANLALRYHIQLGFVRVVSLAWIDIFKQHVAQYLATYPIVESARHLL